MVGDQSVRIFNLLKVQGGPAGDDDESICRKTGILWKISSAADFIDGKFVDVPTPSAGMSPSDIDAAENAIAAMTGSALPFVHTDGTQGTPRIAGAAAPAFIVKTSHLADGITGETR